MKLVLRKTRKQAHQSHLWAELCPGFYGDITLNLFSAWSLPPSTPSATLFPSVRPLTLLISNLYIKVFKTCSLVSNHTANNTTLPRYLTALSKS